MSVLEQPLVFVDIETNGLNHIRGRVVEVAAIRVENGQVVRKFVSFVNPGYTAATVYYQPDRHHRKRPGGRAAIHGNRQ